MFGVSPFLQLNFNEDSFNCSDKLPAEKTKVFKKQKTCEFIFRGYTVIIDLVLF